MMLKPYHNPIVAHQLVERFGIRSFLQNQLLNQQSVVPPEVMLKSNEALPNDIFRDISVSPTVPEAEASPLTGIDMEFKAEFGATSTDQNTDSQDIRGDTFVTDGRITAGTGFVPPPDCLPPEIEIPHELTCIDIDAPAATELVS